MSQLWLRHRGTLIPVHMGDCLVGRSPECGIVLTSARVSREHAVVRRAPLGLEIQDLGSRNGTWVNGQRIGRPCALVAGDRVELGDDVLEVVLQPQRDSAATVMGLRGKLESARQRAQVEPEPGKPQ